MISKFFCFLGYTFLVFLGVVIFWFFIIPYSILLTGPFTLKEIDINNSSFITPSEAEYFYNHGKRKIEKNGKTCTEYFAYKDGVALKTVCE